MNNKTQIIQKRYEGFLQTSNLWKVDQVFGIKQFEIISKSHKISLPIDEQQRLGKYIERFVSLEINQNTNIQILAENIQIQQNKRTLGELDCLLMKDNLPVHLEIVYKFYLYDDSVGNSEIEHFIGPNKKDSLVEKLKKLKEKQLPLLYTDECKNYLQSIKLENQRIQQQVYFKAQLFLPYLKQGIKLKLINQNCVAGFYITKDELQQFTNCKFYIPIKKDWLIIPHKNVDWLNFTNYKVDAIEFLERKFSPLCWIKYQNGEIKKFFLSW